MHIFPPCTVIWTIFQNSVIYILHSHSDAIVKSSLIQVFWIISTLRRNYYASSCTTNRNSHLNYINFHLKSSAHNLQNQLIKHIFAFIVCVNLVTPASLWRHISIAMHVTQNTMTIFSTSMIRHRRLREFVCRCWLRNVSKRMNACHNRI